MCKSLESIVKELNLFKPNETVVLALSGGVDSMVLFDVLKKLDLRIIIAHINHQKRTESKKEYIALKELGNGIDIIFEGFDLPVKTDENFHAYAREQRLKFFQMIADKYQTKKVVLAHHLDDQIESFLMRLTKGASFLTLTGMDYVEDFAKISLIRPFIQTPKQALIDYSKTHNITFFEDASNAELEYTRNRYRHKIVPFLMQENPAFHETFLRFHDNLTDATNCIQDQATNFLKATKNSMSINSFLALPTLTQEAILNMLIKAFYPNYSISKGLLETVNHQLKHGAANLRLPLYKDIECVKSYTHFTVERVAEFVPEEVIIEDVGTYPIEGNKALIVSHNKSAINTTNSYELWYNKKVFPLVYRTRRNGDRIKRPFGSKKIKDLFIDLKIPHKERDRLMLLASGDEILWIPSLNIQSSQPNEGKKLYIYEVLKC